MLVRELEEGVQVETLLSITAHTLSRRELERDGPTGHDAAAAGSMFMRMRPASYAHHTRTIRAFGVGSGFRV